MSRRDVVLLCGWLLAVARGVAGIDGSVATESGLVKGVPDENSDLVVFKGIPYAAPPVGMLRWRAPLPPRHWRDVRLAKDFGPIPMQLPQATGSFYWREYFQGAQPPMSEDCLSLNIWTAAASPGERLPVMVWIYGGGMTTGYGSESCFDGTGFAQKGVVLVTFNYRLGIFGLFAHPGLTRESVNHVSGNYAELDQLAALRWVRNNIAGFGGDPSNVTVFGQSAGASSIDRLLVCPLAKGLFQKVILQSSAFLTSRDSKTSLADMERRGIQFGRAMGALSLNELRALPAAALLSGAGGIRFSPNIDGWVLPDLAVRIVEREGEIHVPTLIGSNSDEVPFVTVGAEAFRQDVLAHDGPYGSAFLKWYPCWSDAQAAQANHDERRDESFAGARAEARDQAEQGQPAYLYLFSRKPPGHDRPRYGAFHAAEIEYVFNTFEATPRPWEPIDREISAAMMAYWVNFARTSNPNGPGLPPWRAYNAKADELMEFGDTIRSHAVKDADRITFVESLARFEAH